MRHRTTAATTTPTAISMAMSKSHQLASCDHSRSSTDVNGAMQGRSVWWMRMRRSPSAPAYRHRIVERTHQLA
jgi:hypothetical protein